MCLTEHPIDFNSQFPTLINFCLYIINLFARKKTHTKESLKLSGKQFPWYLQICFTAFTSFFSIVSSLKHSINLGIPPFLQKRRYRTSEKSRRYHLYLQEATILKELTPSQKDVGLGNLPSFCDCPYPMKTILQLHLCFPKFQN